MTNHKQQQPRQRQIRSYQLNCNFYCDQQQYSRTNRCFIAAVATIAVLILCTTYERTALVTFRPTICQIVIDSKSGSRDVVCSNSSFIATSKHELERESDQSNGNSDDNDVKKKIPFAFASSFLTSTGLSKVRHAHSKSVWCVPIDSYNACNGTIKNLHCRSTYIVSITNYEDPERAFVTNDIVYCNKVCSMLLSFENKYEPPVCIQDYKSNLCVLVSQNEGDKTGTNKEDINFVQGNDTATIQNFVTQHLSKQVVRQVELKRIDFPLYYHRIDDTDNRIPEWKRDNNFGNMVWRYAASRMLNPITTKVAYDTWDRSNVANGTVHALVVASANALYISKRKMFESLTLEKIRYIKRRNVPTIVLGIGVQVGFDSKTKDVTQTSNVQDSLNSTKLTLPHQYQYDYLKMVSDHQSQPAIGVRGEMTKTICSNSGINNCVLTGCPSLTISRDRNLGRTLQQNWINTLNKVSDIDQNYDNEATKTLHLALTSPSPGRIPEILIALRLIATILDNTSKSHKSDVQVTIIVQDLGDAGQINAYIKRDYKAMHPASKISTSTIAYKEFQNVESWMAFAKTFDLCIAFRIHGSMMFTSSGVPTVIMPTDYRIMELVSAMHLPFILHHRVAQILAESKPTITTRRHLSYQAKGGDGAVSTTQQALIDPNLVILQKLMNQAQLTNFTDFEVNRRAKLRLWKSILEVANLEMDPFLLQILESPLDF